MYKDLKLEIKIEVASNTEDDTHEIEYYYTSADSISGTLQSYSTETINSAPPPEFAIIYEAYKTWRVNIPTDLKSIRITSIQTILCKGEISDGTLIQVYGEIASLDYRGNVIKVI